MSAWARILVIVALVVTLGGCGGAKSSSSAPSSAASAGPSTPSATTTSTTSTTSTTTSVTSSASTRPSRSTTASASSVSGASPGSGNERSAGGATNARVPATFVIGSGGKLNPPVIMIPAFLAVQLTVASGDGRSHRIVLRTPTPHALSVPARGRASIRIGGLRAGHYDIEVDGSMGGALVIGGEPGP